MSGLQSISHDSGVLFNYTEERMSSEEDCTIFKEEQFEGDLESLEPFNTFQFKESSIQVSMSGSQSNSYNNRVIIKEESMSSDEECTLFKEEKYEDYLLRPIQLMETPSTVDVSSVANSQITIKQESLSSEVKDNLSEKDKSKDDSKDFGIFNSSQLNRASGYEVMNIEPSLTHHVFIKEEINYYDEVYSNNMKELPCHKPIEDNTFGSHFLAPCLEPQYQYANGQSAEGERSCENETLLYAQFEGSESFSYNPPIEKQDTNYQKYLNSTDGDSENQMGNIKFCKLCQFSTRNLTKMRTHLWDIHQETIPPPLCCQYCNFQCRTKHSLQQHVFKKHNFGQMPIDCPYCKFKSLSILEVTNHIQEKHHKPKKYRYCPHCDFKNANLGNVRYHIAARHTKEMNYICPICKYKCILSYNMKRHLLKVHNKKINNLSLFEIPIPTSSKVSDVKIKS